MANDRTASLNMKPTRRPIPRYPQAIEQWWQDKAQEKWPTAGKSRILNLLRQEITIQSDRFNKEREFDPMSYGSRDLSILTYGSFFFPRTWTQISLVMAEAIDFRGWQGPRTGPLQILDLGAGSGSGGLAALRLLRDRGVMNPIELQAVDYAGKCLSYLRNVHADLDHLWPDTLLTTEAMDLTKNLPSKSKRGYDFVLLNSTLNEITSGEDAQKVAQRIDEISQLLNPGGFLVIVEPALKAICQKLHQAAAVLAKDDDLHLHGPYFNGAPCPFASKPSRYHSHEVRRRAPPASVQQLNEPLRLSVHDVKFGFVLLSKKEPVPVDESPAVLRLVSPLMKKKGVRSFVGVGGDNEERSYEIQNRDLTIEGRRFVKKFERGDILHLKEWKSFEEGRRIRIPSADAVEVLWSPR